MAKPIKVPCKGCSDRYPTCHDKCEDYKAYKAQRDEIKERMRKDNEATELYWTLAHRSDERTKKQNMKSRRSGRVKYGTREG